MAIVPLLTRSGDDAGSVEIDDHWFGIEPNVPVMHQVVVAQLAAKRSGTQSTKTRREVAGGGAKPWKQKGTGRARQGSIRSPQWRGGGVALGPKPRSYAQRTPKKMINLALRSALSDRAAEQHLVVIESWGFDAPKTSEAVEVLRSLGVEGNVLVIVGSDDANTSKSFRNLPNAHVLDPGQLNAYDVLVSDWVVFTKASLPGQTDGLPQRAAATPAEQPQARAAVLDAPDRLTLEAEWEDLMSNDLPKRAKPGPDAKRVETDPRDRVKPVGVKLDPKIAAGLGRAEREAAFRARATEKPEAADEERIVASTADKPARQSRQRGFRFEAKNEEDDQ